MNQDHYPQRDREERPFALSIQHLIGLLLLLALLAFEAFNFDTTKYALTDFFGNTSFAGLHWATILAIAFCAIDFAGLIRFFSPEQGREASAEVWYLMGAWMLAATLNALMTWWAVTLTLLSHDLGNEIISREELLRFAPLFVAALVWLTRLLFIGAFSVAGGYIFNFQQPASQPTAHQAMAASQASQPPPRKPIRASDKSDSFQMERPSLPQQVRRTPTAVYARGRKK